VAIRDGARALILPTIAEIGGRVRITAEVIDPQTQTTVYSETADGIGKESILPSLDVINQRLRVRLGEALATVSAESKPLEKVATENLEALRAYSLGVNKYASGQFPEALELFRQALQLDAGLASVQVRIGAIRASSGQQEQAVESFSRALEQSARLTTRDALYAEAMRASAQQAPDALVKWATLTERFPDYFTGLGSFAYLNWRDANRFDAKAMAMVEASASSKNPNRMPSLQLMGILELGNGRFAQALAHFADAEAQGLQFTEYHAATQAAMRKFDEAKATLARSPAGAAKGNPAMAITRASLNAALLVDQGKLEQASTLLDEAARAETDGKVLAQAFSIMRLTLISADPPLSGDDLRSAKQQLEDVLAQRKSAQTARRQTLDAQALILAYVLARANERDLARRVLAAIPLADMPSGSSNAKLRSVVEAELDRIEGRHGAGIQRLETLLDGSELFITHVALLDAYAAAGQAGKALQQARWLSGHRGRAYAEVAPDNRLTAFNVQHTTLALLQAAELAVAQKDKDSARAMLKQFLEAWPEASARPALAKTHSRPSGCLVGTRIPVVQAQHREDQANVIAQALLGQLLERLCDDGLVGQLAGRQSGRIQRCQGAVGDAHLLQCSARIRLVARAERIIAGQFSEQRKFLFPRQAILVHVWFPLVWFGWRSDSGVGPSSVGRSADCSCDPFQATCTCRSQDRSVG
jgi:putative peptide modification system cyclase